MAKWMRLHIPMCLCIWDKQIRSMSSRSKPSCFFRKKERQGKARHELLGKKKNRWGREDYRVARKMLFMRCICIWLGKVAGAWIWPQTIIQCGNNEWGYNSKPLCEYTENLNGRSAPGRMYSYHAQFKWMHQDWCAWTIKVNDGRPSNNTRSILQNAYHAWIGGREKGGGECGTQKIGSWIGLKNDFPQVVYTSNAKINGIV
jgi:hypothetical protein